MMNIANKIKNSTSANLGTFSTVVKWNDQTTTSSTVLYYSTSDVVSYTNKNTDDQKSGYFKSFSRFCLFLMIKNI